MIPSVSEMHLLNNKAGATCIHCALKSSVSIAGKSCLVHDYKLGNCVLLNRVRENRKLYSPPRCSV
jgi:late competence protein required for DNA uptake (superfamily II DNA/RNA helicase)